LTSILFVSALKEETKKKDKGKRERRIDASLIAQNLSYIALSKLEKKEAHEILYNSDS
jgi:hypothetical protein